MHQSGEVPISISIISEQDIVNPISGEVFHGSLEQTQRHSIGYGEGRDVIVVFFGKHTSGHERQIGLPKCMSTSRLLNVAAVSATEVVARRVRGGRKRENEWERRFSWVEGVHVCK